MDSVSLDNILNQFKIFANENLGINIDLEHGELNNNLRLFFSTNLNILENSEKASTATSAPAKKEIADELFDFVPDAIVGINTGGTIVLFNKQAESMFGYRRDEVIGNWLEMLMPLHYHQPHQNLIKKYFGNPVPRPMGSAKHDMWGRKKSGEQFPLDISLNYLETENGPIALSAIRDITERKLLYEAIANSQKQLREITSVLPAVVYQSVSRGAHDIHFNFVSNYSNAVFEEEPETICDDSSSLTRKIHPDDLEETLNAINSSNQELTAFSIIFRIIQRSGVTKWLEAIGYPIKNPDGSITRNGCFLDITAKKEAENKLKENLAFTNSLLSSTTSQLAVINRDGIVITTNKAWNDFHAIAPDTSLPRSIAGTDYFALLSQKEMQGDKMAKVILDAMRAILMQIAAPFEHQYFVNTIKGKKWFLLRIMPVEGDSNRLLVAHNDITDIKNVELELLKSKKVYKDLLDTTDEMINTVTLDGKIMWANKAWKKNLLYSEQEVEHLYLKELLTNEAKNGLEERLALLRAGNTIDDFSGSLIAKDGNVIQIKGTIVPIIEEGQVKGTQAFFRNLAELNKERNERIKLENRLSNILDKMITGCMALGFDWSILYINNAAALQARESPEDLIGKSIFEVFPAYLNSKVLLKFRQAMKSRKLASFEEKYTFENGSVKWLEVVIEPIDEGIFIMSTDISEKIEAEEHIRKQQLLLSESQRIAHLGSWEYEIPNNRLTWSDEVFRIFEIDPRFFDETIEAFFDAIHPDDVEMVREVYTESLVEKKSYDLVHRLWLPDGRIKYVHERGENFFDRHGNPSRTVGTVLDVTKEKEAELLLEQNKHKYEQVVQNISDGLMVRNPTGNITFTNRQFLEIFGLSEQDIISTNFIDLVAPEHRDFMANNHLKRFVGDQIPEYYEFLGIRKDGKKIWLDVRVSSNVEKGSVESVQAIVRDITERKKAEEILENQNRELKKINAELDRFVYSTSHDLRAPLMSLLGLIDLCRGTVITDEAIPYFDMMEDSIIRIDETIKEILAYSRNSRMEIVNEQLDIKSLVNKYIDSILHSNDAQNIIFDLDIHEEFPFFCDKFRVGTIIGNLVSNAVKYQRTDEPNKSVWIRFRANPKEGVLTVRDNGEGIAPDKLEKVMEMFYRNSVKSDGSGLGLYICKEIVTKLGGKIEIKSELHWGTTFTVTLPNNLYSQTN